MLSTAEQPLFVNYRTGQPLALGFLDAGVVPFINFKTDYGAKGDGITSDDTAIHNLFVDLNARGTSGAVVYIPPGKYLFNTAHTYTMPTGQQTVQFIGAGKDNTILYFPNASGGLSVNYRGDQSCTSWRDMTFSTGKNGVANALVLNQAGSFLGNFLFSDFQNLCFRGEDAHTGGTNYWATALWVQGISGTNTVNCDFYGSTGTANGIGILYQGVNPNYSIVHNNSKCNFFKNNISIIYGDFLQGVTINQFNMVNGNYGIYCFGGAVGALTQLNITDGNFNQLLDQVSINSVLDSIMIRGCLVYVPANQFGFLLGHNYLFNIIGNELLGVAPLQTGQVGVHVDNTVANGIGVISGNLFQYLNIGVNLAAGSANTNVQSNAYINNNTNTANAGAGNTIGGGSA